MKRLTLSFDNGPSLEVTPEILDLLARHCMARIFLMNLSGPFLKGSSRKDTGLGITPLVTASSWALAATRIYL
jgi:hypothetical protein